VISVAHYQLIPQGTVGVRGQTIGRGALLKFQWNSDQIGYADCFPWPELGDATLDEQLASLKKREVTSLLERSITFAKVDAEARAAGKSVWCDVHGKS
jgi:O-succinylbenzoate synthase